MMAQGGTPLPYTPADYIETDGTAYINTGIIQRSRNFELTISVQWMGSDATADFETFFGYMEAGATTPRSGIHKYTTGYYIFGTNTTLTAENIGTVDNNTHTIIISGNASTQKETLSFDGVLYATATTTSTGIGANTIPFYLGARNRNGSVDNPAKARFYALNYKYFSDAGHTTIVEEYNFIPVRYNGVFGMWDTLTDTFKSSISGTAFTGQLTA